MMRLTEFRRISEIEIKLEEDDDDEEDEEIDILNRASSSNNDVNNADKVESKKKARRFSKEKDKFEKIMLQNISTETLFMKFFKYILLNLTFALNVCDF